MNKILVNRINTNHIKGNELDIYFFGDTHIGSKDCNVSDIKKQIEDIKKNKKAIVILMGDTINCALKGSVGAGSYDDVMNPDKQIEMAVNLLEPIKDKIVGIHNGNHPNRVYKETSISPEKYIASGLNVAYLGDTCFHYLRFKKQTYILFTAHGATGSATVGGALNACMKYSNFALADIYAMGHTHKLGNYAEIYYEVSKKDKTLKKKTRHYLLTGGFLKWKDSYGETKNYAPLEVGCAITTVSGDKYDIKVNTQR